MVATMKP